MDKVKTKKQPATPAIQMAVVHPHAAGIDVSDKEHVVAVPPGADTLQVRSFATMTCELLSLVEWLQQCQVDTVAMESTGVYWKPLFSLPVQKGFEVYLVNARHVKNVSGRKSDALWTTANFLPSG
jgi:transposase